jgi:hypothetical protein
VKYGNGGLEYFFMIVNGTEGASLCLSGVEIEFVSPMNSTVFILGGKVTLEGVKINNQLNTNWVSPLVHSRSNTSSVTVELHSCTITNSNYKTADFYRFRPAIVCFVNEATAAQSITLNISFCLCQNNTFNLDTSYQGGGYGLFYSYNTLSSMWFFFLI